VIGTVLKGLHIEPGERRDLGDYDPFSNVENLLKYGNLLHVEKAQKKNVVKVSSSGRFRK
jgi:hypothetical protein